MLEIALADDLQERISAKRIHCRKVSLTSCTGMVCHIARCQYRQYRSCFRYDSDPRAQQLREGRPCKARLSTEPLMLKLPVDWTRTSLPAVVVKVPPFYFFPAFHNSEANYFGLVEWRALSICFCLLVRVGHSMCTQRRSQGLLAS